MLNLYICISLYETTINNLKILGKLKDSENPFLTMKDISTPKNKILVSVLEHFLLKRVRHPYKQNLKV